MTRNTGTGHLDLGLATPKVAVSAKQEVSPGSLDEDPAWSSKSYVWYVLFILTITNSMNYIDRVALSILLPDIKKDLDLADWQLGLLVGLAFALFYAVCVVPIARWADRGNRKNIITLGLLVWSGMTALCGAAHSFLHLFLARIGVGAGEASCVPTAQSLICDYVPLERRPGFFAIHNFGAMFGSMVGMILAGWLGETLGWRLTFLLLGIPGVAIAAVLWTTLKEPPRGRFENGPGPTTGAPFLAVFRQLWGSKIYRYLLIFMAIGSFVQSGVGQWLPSFYTRVFGLSLSYIGVFLGTATGISAGMGVLVGGWIANRLSERDVRAPLTFNALASCVGVPASIGSLFISSPVGSILLFSLASFVWAMSNGPVIASLYSVTDPRMRATAGAISIFFTSVVGFGLGPFFVGLLSDVLYPEFGIGALRYAMVAVLLLSPLMILYLYAAARSMPHASSASTLSTRSV